MTYLNTFTTLIQEFVTKLSDLYLSDHDYIQIKTYIMILKKTNPRKIVDIFNEHCLQYKTQIINKNEEFLLTYNFIDNDVARENITNESNNQEFFNLMSKIRSYWKGMDKDTTENIWKYLNLFILLNDKLKHT